MDDFPDVNVWIALSAEDHPFHLQAKQYFESTPARKLCFSWTSAMGLIRISCSSRALGGSPLTPSEAWDLYQRWRARDDVAMLTDPSGLEDTIADWVRAGKATPRNWTDLYQAAFARGHALRLVTFDHDFKSLNGLDVLLLNQ